MSRGRRKRERKKQPPPQQIAPIQGPPEQQMRFVATATSYSGPIPPPEMLERFNELIPRGAHRILKMAEKQQDHRHKLEEKVITSDIRRSWGGLAAGLVVAIVSIALGCTLVFNGHDAAGTTIATATVVGLVTAFLTGTSRRKQERAEKAQNLMKSQ